MALVAVVAVTWLALRWSSPGPAGNDPALIGRSAPEPHDALSPQADDTGVSFAVEMSKRSAPLVRPLEEPQTPSTDSSQDIQFRGVPFRELDLDTLDLDSLRELDALIGVAQKPFNKEFRRTPFEHLNVVTSEQYDEEGYRFSDVLVTYAFGPDGDVALATVDENRNREIYAYARMKARVRNAWAWRQYDDAKFQEVVEKARIEHPTKNLVVIDGSFGVSRYLIDADDPDAAPVTFMYHSIGP